MAITQTAISYYGMNYVEHAAADFQEMKDHGCTTVILAVTEFDFDFWRPNIPKIFIFLISINSIIQMHIK